MLHENSNKTTVQIVLSPRFLIFLMVLILLERLGKSLIIDILEQSSNMPDITIHVVLSPKFLIFLIVCGLLWSIFKSHALGFLQQSSSMDDSLKIPTKVRR